MAIKITSQAVVGFRFSDLCALHESASGVYFNYLTKTLEEEIAKKFEGAKIDEDEVDPELLSIIFDLDCFEYVYSDFEDAIIGVEIVKTDIGERNVSLTNVRNVEIATEKVLAHIKEIDPEITKSIKIEIGIVTKMRETQIK